MPDHSKVSADVVGRDVLGCVLCVLAQAQRGLCLPAGRVHPEEPEGS